MANVKISQLPSGSIPTALDIIPIVDYETLVTTGIRAQYMLAFISSSIEQLNLNSLTASHVQSNTLGSTRGNFSSLTGSFLTGTAAIFNSLTGNVANLTRISGSSMYLDDPGLGVKLQIRSRVTNNPTILQILNVNGLGAVHLGSVEGTNAGVVGAMRDLKIIAGTEVGSFQDIIFGIQSETSPIERFALRQNSKQEAVFNDSKNAYNFRVSGQVNQNLLVITASLGYVGIGIQPQEQIHLSGNIRIDGQLYGYSSAYTSLTASHTLSNGDNGRVVMITSPSQATLTIPTNLTGGFGITILQSGTGSVFVTGALGVTVFNRSSHTRTAGQYAMASILYLSGNAFVFAGDTML